MTGAERELARKLREANREAKRGIAAHAEIQRATREGCAAALQAAQEQVEQARRDADRERFGALEAMRQAGTAQQHNGLLYRRIKAVGALVKAWEPQLPEEFVVAAREQTDPDFAALLGMLR